MKQYFSQPLKRAARKLLYPLPVHLAKHQRHISQNGLRMIEASIKENYHVGWRSEHHYSKEMYHHDLQAHLHERLENDRRTIVPWLDHARPLRHMRILEIGCGTGSSTVALGEQGAHVTGIDIDEGALSVARDRAKAYGVAIDLKVLNAEMVSRTFPAGAFDSIIFFACLEHMTIDERLRSLRETWNTLPVGGLLVIIDTPNRLWYFDGHTSLVPFFHWLPNDLAFLYSRFSPRENFREVYTDYNSASKEHFLRRGRGVSFHELDLAITSAKNLKVVSSMSSFQGLMGRFKLPTRDRQYKSLLMKLYPGLHEGFFDEMLCLILEKE